MEPKIKAIECRFAVYIPPPRGMKDDYHFVKEVIHYEDNTTKNNLRAIPNYKRPFYITQEMHRNHKDKKEYEEFNKVNVYKSRQCDLVYDIARALNYQGRPRGLKDICQAESPASPKSKGQYVYGADILSTAVLKRQYKNKWPDTITPYSVATLDIETTMHEKNIDKRILCCTIATHDKIYTVIHKKFVEGHATPEIQLQKLAKQYAEPLESVKREWEVEIVDEELDIVLKTMAKLHVWQPDILAIWNMIFDIKVFEHCLNRNGVDPARIFSDPSIPPAYRYYEFIEGSEFKISAAGTRQTKEGSERWHTVVCPASFYIIDAMCLYRAIRNQETKDPSYGLGAIQKKELKTRGKLGFDDLTSAEEGTADWHTEMQAEYPLHYIVYNRYDSTGMLELEAKTKDLSINLAFFSGVSDFCNFNSQPRRIVDDLDAFYWNHKGGRKVVATTGLMKDDNGDFLDKYESLVIGRDGWIATLDPELFEESNSMIFCDAQGVYHHIHINNADLDVTSAYPNAQRSMNISKKTTHKEMVLIDGVDQRMRRIQGLNLSGGYINAVEIGVELFGLPQLDEWVVAWREDHPQ